MTDIICAECAALRERVAELEGRERERVKRLGHHPNTVREACAKAEAERDALRELVETAYREGHADAAPRPWAHHPNADQDWAASDAAEALEALGREESDV